MNTIHVCVGSSCHLRGSYDIIRLFEKLIKENNLEDEFEIKAQFCFGNCRNPVSVKIGDEGPFSVEKEKAEEFFKEKILG